MKASTDLPLALQREALREKIQAQRLLIAEQLGPAPKNDTRYPRSKTMQFLTRRPGMAVTLLAEGAAMLLGARYTRSVTAAMAVARIVRSASNAGPRVAGVEQTARERSATS